MSGLKMAKAEKEEFERTTDFVNVMDSLFDGRSFFSREEDWRDWPDDNEDKKTLLAIEEEVKESDGTDWNGNADNRIILYEFIKRKWRQANFSGSFNRIIMDAHVLIENACDPDLDYLEFKPEIKAAIEEYEKNHGSSSLDAIKNYLIEEAEECGDAATLRVRFHTINEIYEHLFQEKMPNTNPYTEGGKQ